MNKHFKNEPLTDFGEAKNREILSQALSKLDREIQFGQLIAQPVINGQAQSGGELYSRFDPSDKTVLVGKTTFATLEQTKAALSSVSKFFHTYRDIPTPERAKLIARVGAELKQNKARLTALLIREAGKPWKEADADVAEAIDFCMYYADQVSKLGTPALTQQVLGEDNHYLYEARGTVSVIAPWNFPLAILCGMVVAALVTGNTVLIKPSEQTSLVGFEFYKALEKAGIPKEAMAFLPGQGEVVGRELVSSPLVDMIAFTGSRPVGFEIIKNAAFVHPGQRSIKRVVAELGGKNAIIVDSDADLDDALRGILSSTFGFAGQKCSACSRLIVVGELYEPLLQRLGSAAKDFLIGKASDPSTLLGPVIDQETQERIRGVIQRAQSELTPLLVRDLPNGLQESGNFVSPAIFRDVPKTNSLWSDEVFGPVLACNAAATFEDAVGMALDSNYALTGGVFSRHPEHIEYARKNFRVGNLYINRGCTGAIVERQPFGGSRHSGVGSKAGGPDYLLQFVEPRTISENTMRRGFAPGMEEV